MEGVGELDNLNGILKTEIQGMSVCPIILFSLNLFYPNHSNILMISKSHAQLVQALSGESNQYF